MSNFQKDNDILCTFYFASHIQTIILTTIIILNSNGTINCQQHTCYLKADNLEIDTSLEIGTKMRKLSRIQMEKNK